MAKILLLVLISLTACVPHSQMRKTDQSEWKEISCSGIKSWQDCRTQAQRLCPSGYYKADEIENLTIQRRVMSISCKN